jgi:hypothetical protein
MSDTQLLLLVLVLVYLWECTHWVRRGSVTWVRFWGKRWRAFHPGGVVGNQHGGAVPSQPLPPLGGITVARQFPLSLSPEGVLAYVAYSVNPQGRPAQSGRWWRWDAIQKVEADFKKVRVNGEVFLSLGSPTYAQYVAAQLEMLRKLPQAQRAEAVRSLCQKQFDTNELQKQWEQFTRLARPLRGLGNVLFFYLFALIPAVVWYFGIVLTWLWLGIGLLALTFSTATIFKRRHATLFPAADDDRFTQFLIILLSPASAVRAQDILSRPVLEAFHPLAAAQVLGGEVALRELAARMWREVNHPARPVCPGGDAQATAAEEFARGLFREELVNFFRRQKLNESEFSRAPEPADANCRSYCPRCEAQFTKSGGECADCGGIPLMAFAAEKK